MLTVSANNRHLTETLAKLETERPVFLATAACTLAFNSRAADAKDIEASNGVIYVTDTVIMPSK